MSEPPGKEETKDGEEEKQNDAPQDNIPPDTAPDETTSITNVARKDFEKGGFSMWNVTTPILIKDLSLLKDPPTRRGCCRDPAIADDGLLMAPNFATALLGRRMAAFLRLNGPPPPKNLSTASGARRSDNDNGGGYVFKDVNALLLPGESTLILGPSSSGKTSLLRTICDKINGKIRPNQENVEGKVFLGAVEPSDYDEDLSRATAFVDQTDVTLTPVLTVEETVKFASACADGTSEALDDIIEALFRHVGLDHVKSTVVGDAELRGVSGGQKRRVKVLEMAVGSNVRLMAMDEISTGLDAASALTICKIVRVAVEAQGTTAVTTLLQPSVEALNTFHRLILLTPDGGVAYSGKTEDSMAHFESLGLVKPSEMNQAEFLLRCACSPSDFWEAEGGRIPPNASSSAALAMYFPESPAGRALLHEINQVEAQEGEKMQDTTGRQKEGTKKTVSFAQPTYRQILLLMGRGRKLVARNPASLQRVISSIIFGAFIGTLFLNTGTDARGTSVRAGYVLTLLFLSFLNSSSAPIDDWFRDRLTFYTHRRASFYRTSSYYIAEVLYSAPVALTEAFFLSVISFFSVGMTSQGGWGFMYFWAMFSLVAICGTAVSRVLAYGLPSSDIAQSLGPAVLLLFVLGACYSPQYLQLPTWLRWLAWISPCAYCYEGVIVNEVRNRNVGDENGQLWAQENLGIPRISYMSAPSGLSTEGLVMAFDAYMLIILTVVFDVLGCRLLHASQKWFGPTTKRYQVASGMSLTAPPWYESKDGPKSSQTSSVEKGETDEDETLIPPAPRLHLTAKDIVYEVDVPIETEEKAGQDATVEKKDEAADTPDEENVSDELLLAGDEVDGYNDVLITAREYGQAGNGKAREWVIKRRLGEDALAKSSESLTLSSRTLTSDSPELPPPEPGRLRLLSGITASFEPGTITALMGSSGAGKSTLLDVLAGYKTGGHIEGDIRINGQPKTDKTWRSIAGYCEQVDLHNPSMTVRESLIFAARLRLRPFDLPDEARTRFAGKILKVLDLEEFADMLVGDEASGQGLPKHARKRLTVGVELAGNPSILFADEPSSGLDSLSASVVVSCLERIAKQQGLTVVCTIHQPSREVFSAFDNLLLLRKGGVCVYNGSIASLDSYLESVPNANLYTMPKDANPADHVLAVFCGPLGEEQDWGRIYKRSDTAEAALSSCNSCACDSCESGEVSVDSDKRSFSSELWIVAQRQLVSYWRTPTYMAVRFWWTLVATLLVGLVYFRTSDITNVLGSIFFYTNIATVPLMSAVVPLISDRAVYYREVASGTYQRRSYGVAVQIAEIPFNMFFAILSFVLFYFLVGLKTEGERVVYFLLMALAAYWLLPTVGQLFAFLSPNVGAAVGTASLLITVFTLTMGFLLPANEIPPWWIWIYWINPLRYVQQGLTVNEIGGDPVGDEILSMLTWSYNDRWWYCYVAVILFAIAASVGVVASTRISWLKR